MYDTLEALHHLLAPHAVAVTPAGAHYAVVAHISCDTSPRMQHLLLVLASSRRPSDIDDHMYVLWRRQAWRSSRLGAPSQHSTAATTASRPWIHPCACCLRCRWACLLTAARHLTTRPHCSQTLLQYQKAVSINSVARHHVPLPACMLSTLAIGMHAYIHRRWSSATATCRQWPTWACANP